MEISIKLKVQQVFDLVKGSIRDFKSSKVGSKGRYRRILLTGSSTAVVKIISAIINLVSVPLTVNYLGAERYGLWMAISSSLALMSFADLGLGNGLLNSISRANGRNDIKDAQVAVSSTFYLLLSISSVLLILFTSIYFFIPWESFFNVKTALAQEESGPTVFVMVVVFLLNLPLGIVQRIQDGYQEGYKYQLWLILGTVISFLALLLCIFFELGLVWLVISFTSGQLIVTIINAFILFTRSRIYLKPSLKFFDFAEGKVLIKSGLVFFMLVIFTLLGNTTDNIIIAKVLGAESVAGYEIVRKIFVFSMFTQFLIQPLWPAFAEAVESGDIVWAKNTLKKGLIYSVLIGAITTIPLVLFGKQIITFWVGRDYIPSWSLLLGFYAFVIISNYGGVMSTFLNSGPLLTRQLLIVGLASFSAIALKFILVGSIGVSGVVWATVIGYSVFFILPSYKIAFNYLNNLLQASQDKSDVEK